MRTFILKPFTLLLSILAGLPLTGCTTSIVSPTASVTSIALVEQSADAAKVMVTVELKSDNAVPLPLVECDYRVSLEGFGTFSFKDLPNKSIPARRTDINAGPATQMVTLLAVFATQGREVKGADCQVSGTVMYEPPGEIRKIMTDSAVPRPTVGFSGEARLE